jgi:hypothetical protein
MVPSTQPGPADSLRQGSRERLLQAPDRPSNCTEKKERSPKLALNRKISPSRPGCQQSRKEPKAPTPPEENPTRRLVATASGQQPVVELAWAALRAPPEQERGAATQAMGDIVYQQRLSRNHIAPAIITSVGRWPRVVQTRTGTVWTAGGNEGGLSPHRYRCVTLTPLAITAPRRI